jgi:hypothetical protein
MRKNAQVDIQDKEITIEVVNGFTPKFTLASWATKAEAEEVAKAGFAEKQFIRVTKIAEVSTQTV